MFEQIIGYICVGVIIGALVFAEVVFFIWAHTTDKEFKEKYGNKKNNREG